jgi:hypothetical protein
VDSMLRFRLERGCNRTKHCQKMLRRQCVLAPWEVSAAQRGDVATSVGGEAESGREMGGDDVSWADTNLTGAKNEENPCGRFSWYK